MLQKAGGLFQLLAEVDFGTAFGVKSLYYKSRTTNPADAGQVRLARADVISWRNQLNSGNLDLSVNSSNALLFNGNPLQGGISVTDTATIDLTFVADSLSADIINGSITNAMINAAAAIAYSKLNLTGGIVNADVNASAAIAYSKLNLTGSIVNADVNASAAIAYSKLNLSGSIVNADVSASAAIAYSKLALTGSIVNADISASAAIAFSKLATLSSTNILVGSAGNVATSVAMSGDITIGNTGVTAIGANKVTNAMLAQVSTATFKGRTTAATGNVEDLTATQATALLNTMVGDSGSGGTKGLVPAPSTGDATRFLNGAGAWSTPAGAGDVTGPGSATDNGFVRFDGTTGKLIKNSAATIVNADVSASAAIAYSKLTLTGSIVNADINASAAIALTKLAAMTVSRAVVSDGSGFLTPATTTATEIGYVNGVTSAIQTQLNAKAATFSPSEIVRGTADSRGGSSSGDTCVVNYSAAITSTGSAITFTGRTTTTGDFYTINTTGVYAIWATARDNVGGDVWGITVNSSGTSTAPQSLTASQVPVMIFSVANNTNYMGCTVPLSAGDIVRVQTESGVTVTSTTAARFGITRVS